MPHAIDLLQDLAIVMIVAGLVTIVFHRLRQPVVLGYIIAGVIIGPHTPPFPLIRDEHSIETLAEIGVIFLMFNLGLHFSLRKLAQVGATAIIGAVLEIVLMFVIGYELGRLFGWSTLDSIFLGAILSISSTTIIVKALADMGLSKQRFAQLIFGILVAEDILAIAMLAVLSSIDRQNATVDLGGMVRILVQLALFLASLLVVGLLAVPVLLRYVARFRSNEMLLVATLGLCFGVSLLAAKMEYSVALGAFLIGAIIAEAREAGRIEQLIEPLRDMFSAVFFVAIGMLIDPRLLVQYAVPIIVITVAVVVGKVITCSTGAFLAGNDTRTSVRVGMGLAQIGEFSFIIAQLGLARGLTSDFIYPIAVSVSAVTTLLTPYLIRSSDPVVSAFDRFAPRAVLAYLDTYQRWTQGLREGSRHGNQLRKLMRKWALQIVLNIALVTAMLIIAKWLATRAKFELPGLPVWSGGTKTVIWLIAMLAALPLLVATLRKMRAVATVLAEASTRAGDDENLAAARTAIATAILIPAALAVGVWILAVSAALLPPWPVLVVLLLVIAGVTAIRWNMFIKMYARAQIALKTTLTETHPEPPQQSGSLPLLRDARMESVAISSGSRAAGRLIRELQLRTLTGASAVGIERDGISIINPGPDEELAAGDRVLLLGNAEQLAAARSFLEGEASSNFSRG